MTSTSDLLAFVDAEIDALKAKKLSPDFPEFPNERESQPVDFIGSPGFPVFPGENLKSSVAMNFGAVEEERSRAIIEDTRAKPIVSENTGKTGNPLESRDEDGKKPGKTGISGKLFLKEEREDLISLFEERAAIREFEGGFARPTAQSFALDDCTNELTGHSADRRARDDALDRLRAAGITQPVLFPEGEPFDAPF